MPSVLTCEAIPSDKTLIWKHPTSPNGQKCSIEMTFVHCHSSCFRWAEIYTFPLLTFIWHKNQTVFNLKETLWLTILLLFRFSHFWIVCECVRGEVPGTQTHGLHRARLRALSQSYWRSSSSSKAEFHGQRQWRSHQETVPVLPQTFSLHGRLVHHQPSSTRNSLVIRRNSSTNRYRILRRFGPAPSLITLEAVDNW